MKVRIAISLILTVGSLCAENKAVERCNEAARLLDEIMAAPEKSVPKELLEKAHCVALIPGVKKVGFVFAGKYGKGALLCRRPDGQNWTGPSAVRLEGGSFGLQVGASSTDVVLLVMNRRGAQKLLSSKFTLGADAAVAGGPVGRLAQAQTDAQMHAKILSYSRSRGVFAGVSLEGATLRPDAQANLQLYGRDVSHQQILTGEMPAPEPTKQLLQTLQRYSAPEPTTALSQNNRQQGVEALEDQVAKSRKRGLLKITSEPPYATVELNQNFNGLTPRAKSVRAGEYEVTLQKNGFQVWSGSVTVAPGKVVTVHAELQKQLASTADDADVKSPSSR